MIRSVAFAPHHGNLDRPRNAPHPRGNPGGFVNGQLQGPALVPKGLDAIEFQQQLGSRTPPSLSSPGNGFLPSRFVPASAREQLAPDEGCRCLGASHPRRQQHFDRLGSRVPPAHGFRDVGRYFVTGVGGRFDPCPARNTGAVQFVGLCRCRGTIVGRRNCPLQGGSFGSESRCPKGSRSSRRREGQQLPPWCPRDSSLWLVRDVFRRFRPKTVGGSESDAIRSR
mmetsp:Transcript_20336/g.42399  ORF Transcript_20336/g.42399 Transcript_20336/m.42399 type:complete len:225 (-) Transcript_20336:568-1242(-)